MARKKKTQYQNDETYLMYYDRLYNYAITMFEWTGLPEEINKRFLEVKMLEEGKLVFFKDDSLGFLTLPVNVGGVVNVYQEPTKYYAMSVNYHKELDPDEAIIIWNNYTRTPILPIIRQYARRLMEVQRAIDVNISGQRTPLLILAEETQRLSLLNAMEQYEGNEHFIFGNKSGFDKEAFQVLLTPVPYVTDKLTQYKHDLWNEVMTFLGVGNAKQDKKERLVSDEVAANDEQIEGSRYIMLQARQDACEQINKLFGLNVSVDFKLRNEDPEIKEGDEEWKKQ